MIYKPDEAMGYDSEAGSSQQIQVEAPSVFTDVQVQSEYTKTDANDEQRLLERQRSARQKAEAVKESKSI